MKRILVALDNSPNSSGVLASALEQARTLGGKLRLLSVVPVPPPPPPPGILLGNHIDELLRSTRHSLTALADTLPPEHRDGVALELGDASAAILRAARTYHADLVVIGAHAYGRIERVLGTTAARVVNRCDRPVLVVRPPPAVVDDAPSREGSPRETEDDADADTLVPTRRGHDDHPLLEAATLVGTASGAAIGAFAGPAGAIVGGSLGATVGLLTGQVLDRQAAAAARHDAELDNAIGVTEGPIGAREAAVRGLAANEQLARQGNVTGTGAVFRASDLLRGEHTRLEAIYRTFLDAYRNGDWNDVRAQWQVFEPALLSHMALEEEQIFPFFREADPVTTERLQREHDELRKLLETLAVNLELHAVNAHTAEELIGQLRLHGEREARVLYPWLEVSTTLDLSHLTPAA